MIKIGNDLEGRGHSIIEALSRYLGGRAKENRCDGAPTEI
jgi:hypothetical protein